MLEVITAPSLENIPIIKHGFFTRKGGVSTGVYASLNCCYAGKDCPDLVRENRCRITSHFNQPFESLVSVKNVHGNEVVIVEKPWLEHLWPQADAMVTKEKNLILGADTADCACVLFADEKHQIIGLCHAGWRGAKSGIIAATIEKMIYLGARRENITAVIGPCISQDSYEVDLHFYQQFLEDEPENTFYFKPSSKAQHFLFDLRHFVQNQLLQLQLGDVSAIELDTYTNEEQFFSYRRTTHRQESDFGGHFAAIYLK